MQGLAVFAALGLVGYGLVVGGLLGALTGFVAGVGVGSGLAIFFGERGTGVAGLGTRLRASQQIGGLLAAVGCGAGVIYGGWHLGWAWGSAGWVVGVLLGLFFAALTGSLRSDEHSIGERGRGRSLVFTVYAPTMDEARLLAADLQRLLDAEGVDAWVTSCVVVPEVETRLGITRYPAYEAESAIIWQGSIPSREEVQEWLRMLGARG